MANRYWRGYPTYPNAAWTPTSTANWAASAGGNIGASVPTLADDVFFQSNAPSFNQENISIQGAVECRSITMSGGYRNFIGTGTLTIAGSFTNTASNLTWNTGDVTFTSTSTGLTIQTGNISMGCNVYIYGVGASWYLNSNLTLFHTATSTPRDLEFDNGSLILNGYNITCGKFKALGTSSRSIEFGTGNITLNQSSGTVLNIPDATALQFSGTGGFISDASVARTYTVGTTGGALVNSPNLTFTGSDIQVQTFTTGSYFKTLNFGSTAFNPGTTSLNLNGLTLSSGGTFTGLTATMVGTGTITGNSKTIAALTINSTSGTTTFAGNLSTNTTATTTLTSGTLALASYTLTTGIFSSSNTNTRAITFGTGNIVLAHTTAATTVLNMATATGLTVTGTGGFTSDASVTRTYTFGTTGGSTTNAPNLTLTGSGTQVQTFTTGSYFNTLSFGTTAFNPGTTSLNLNGLTLSSGGTFTNLTPTMVGTGTITSSTNTTLASLTINGAGTTTLGDNFSLSTTSTTTLTAGTLALGGFTLTTGIFSSNNTNTRRITLGANNIVLSHATAAQTVLNIADVTGLTLSGTGGFTSDASVTRTYVYGTTGSILYQPNLSLTGSGTAVQTLTTGSYFNSLSFGTTAFDLGTTALNIAGNLTLSSGGTFSGLTATLSGTGTITSNTNTTLSALTIAGASITVTLGDTLTMSATSTFNLSQGTLTLNGFNLTTGRFLGSTIATRSINFGTNNIILAHTTAATTVLSMATATGFTYTGTGGFTATAAITRTYTFGTTGGSSTNAPNLSLTGSGTQVQTFTTGSWFGTLSFGTTAFDPGTTSLNLSGLTLSSGGTFANLTPTMVGTGTITSNTNTTLASLTINSTSGTTTLGDALTTSITSTTTLTSGTLALNGFDLTTGIFSSDNSNTRSITFGSNNIVLAHTTAAQTVLSMATATGFTYTGTGGFTATAAVTRTYVFGTTGGTSANSPNLSLTGSGTQVQTFTTGSYFNTLSFGTTAFNPGTTSLNLNSLTLSSGGTFTGLTATMVGSGTITSSTNATLGALTINGGTILLGDNFSLSATGTVTFTTGVLALQTFSLTTGIFNSSGALSRTLIFNANTITLVHPNAGTTVLNIPDATNLTITSTTGGFTATAAVTRTYTFGTTGGTSANAPNLAITGSGTQVQTLTTGSWFKNLSFDNTGFNLGTTALNIAGNLTLSFGNFSGLTVTMVGSGTITSNGGAIAALTITTGTTTLGDALTTSITSTTTLTSGTLALNGFDLTTGSFSSNNANTRTITLGANNIVLAHTTAAQTVLDMATVTGLTLTGTGGFTSDASVTRTYVFGTTGGTSANAPSLSLTGSDTAVQTFTTGSYFGSLSFGTTAFNLGTTALNIAGNLTLSNGGTFTGLTVTMISSGTITSNNKTIAALTITTGTTTFAGNLSTNTTATTTLTSGTLNLVSYNLTTGIFSSDNSNTRVITFGTGNIVLSHPTAAQTVLNMATVTGLTLTGTGGFTSDASVTRTYAFGSTAGGTSANSPNLTLTGSGTQVQTFTTGSYFGILSFGTTAFDPGTTALSLSGLTLSSGGTFTGLTVTMVGTGTITGNNKTIAALTITTGTITFAGDLSTNTTATTTFTSGTLNLVSYTLTTGIFSSNNANIRTITFGTGNIVLSHPTAAQTVLSMATATNLTLTGTGGFKSDASVTRTYIFGTTGGTSANSPNLTLTGSGTAVQTFTTGSYFNTLSFGTTAFNPGATFLNLSGLTLSSGGTFTNLTANMVGTGTITSNTRAISTLTINGSGITTTLGDALSIGITSTTTLTAGTLALNGFDLTTGRFSSSNSNTRAIAFGTNNIVLAHTTAAQIVLFVATATNLTLTGTGGFKSDASVTRTYTFGSTAGGTSANSPNLSLTGSGTAVQTFTTGSYFNTLSFGTTIFNPGTTSLNLNGLTLSSGGTFTTLTPTMVGTGTITGNTNTTLASLTINGTGTTTLGDNFSLTATSTTTLTTGTLALNGFNLTTGIFSSSNTNTRAITFGTNNIVLAHTTAATTVLSMDTATGFTCTGTGGFTADASRTRTYTFGTTGGTATNAPNLSLTDSGTSVQTFTTGSYFNTLSFGTTIFNPGTTSLNLNGLTLSSGGTFTELTVTMVGTGTVNLFGKTIFLFRISSAGTVTLANAVTTAPTTSIGFQMDGGTLNCAGYDITCTGKSCLINTGTNTINNIGTISCSTFQITATLTTGSGTISATTSVIVSGGIYNYYGGTITTTLVTLTTSGQVILYSALTLLTTCNFNIYESGGTLALSGGDLSVGSFSVTKGTLTHPTATITCNAYNINLTGAGTVLNIPDMFNVVFTGTGGVSTDATASRTYTVGTTAFDSTTSVPPKLTFTGTGTAIVDPIITNNSTFKSLSFNDGLLNNTGISTTNIILYGDLTSNTYSLPNVTFTFSSYSGGVTGNISVNGDNSCTIGSTTIDATAGTFTLQKNTVITPGSSFTLTNGVFNTNNYNLTTSAFLSTNSNTRTLSLGSSTIYLKTPPVSTNSWDFTTTTGLTLNSGTSTIYFQGITSGSNPRTFAGGGKTYYNLYFQNGGDFPTNTVSITGSNTFNNLLNDNTYPITIIFPASATQTLSNFQLSGASLTNLTTIKSSTTGVQATLSKASGTVNVNYLSIQDINATGGARWIAQNSVNVSNNSGWLFNNPAGTFLMFFND